MKTLRKELNNVQGGCNYSYMLNELLKENGIKEAKLFANWKNDKDVFEIEDTKYIISDSSYIFNYDGVLELEEFTGAVREIKEDNNIRSSYACTHDGIEGLDTFIVDFQR